MKDTIIYNYNFTDHSIELDLELEVYQPRHPDIDDVRELQILGATVTENTGEYKEGQEFDINLIDADDVAEMYFNQ